MQNCGITLKLYFLLLLLPVRYKVHSNKSWTLHKVKSDPTSVNITNLQSLMQWTKSIMPIIYSNFWLCFYYRPTFGTLQDIPGKEYLDAVDKENANVVIVMHLYQPVSRHINCEYGWWWNLITSTANKLYTMHWLIQLTVGSGCQLQHLHTGSYPAT